MESKLVLFEQFLNKRKESVLQQEVILQELNQILSKFKREAEEKRKRNLKTVSKTNSLKTNLQKLVKKIMMYVSEISITQALLVSQTHERDELSEEWKEMQKRMREGEPPTSQSEFNFLKVI